MHIEKLGLIGFKNYEDIDLDFSVKINCFVGPNGSGKTNLLDAIHYLSMTRSAFNLVDTQNILFGQNLFSIKGTLFKEGRRHEVLCAVSQGQKKIMRVDGNEHEKLSDHIGLFPVVLIAPDDTDIIRGPGEIRRKFFDMILSQLDRDYLQKLIRYNHFLKQRNTLLKQFSQGQAFEQDLLAPYNRELIVLGNELFGKRRDFMKEFLDTFHANYSWLSEEKEEVDIRYRSDNEIPDFESAFNNALSRDLALERTTIGLFTEMTTNS